MPHYGAVTSLGRPSSEDEAMQPLNWKVMTLSLALFSGFSFVVCVAWGLAVPPGVHGTRPLEMTLPGFVWLTPGHLRAGARRDDRHRSLRGLRLHADPQRGGEPLALIIARDPPWNPPTCV